MKITTSLLLFAALAWSAASNASAATVPAGTDLLVKTLDVINSADARGKKFPGVLLHDVSVKEKVVLPAGTKVTGQIVTSRRMMNSPETLTVSVVDVTVGGHVKPVQTGAIKLENYTSSGGTSFSHGYYHVAKGRKLHFRLGAPLEL
jgi:hypothetical protein